MMVAVECADCGWQTVAWPSELEDDGTFWLCGDCDNERAEDDRRCDGKGTP